MQDNRTLPKYAEMDGQPLRTLPNGARFGNYEILGTLGAGGMGVVYRAYDSRLGRPVAIKTLATRYSSDPSRLSHFEREAKALSSINHPNIVTLYALGEPEGTYYIVMEFVEGLTLRQHIAAQKMRLSSVLNVGTQMASALSAAHSAGILHRDIKPENVMLRPDGLVKILDFGLAKLTQPHPASEPVASSSDVSTRDTMALDVSAASPNPYLTTPNELAADASRKMVLGTAAYMSPERLRGQEVDVRADIFSLGVTLYELVAGVTPFGGRSSGEVINAVFDDEPPPLSRYRPQVPRDLEHIIRKALRKDRDCRYQDSKDLLIDLQDVQHERDFEATLKRSSEYELFDQARMMMTGQGNGETISLKPIEASKRTTPNGATPYGVFLSEIVNEKLGSGVDANDEVRVVVLIEWRHAFKGSGKDDPGNTNNANLLQVKP